MQKLILGSANFTGKYGFGTPKKINENAVKQVINIAQLKGINRFDTAMAYRGVDEKLGRYLDKRNTVFLDTKIGASDCISVESIIKSVIKTLEQIGLPKISSLYAHNSDLIINDHENIVKKGMEKLIELGLVDYIGVSVYDISELLSTKKIFPSLTRFQITENICDRRLINSSEMEDIAESGNEINVRSIFLQGILLTTPENLQPKFHRAIKAVHELNQFAREQKVSCLDLCVAYACSIKWASNIVVGVDSASQLAQIVGSDYILSENWVSNISGIPSDLLDPRFW